MATKKQREAAKKNIKKAQDKWESMSPAERGRAQPEGRAREKPGSTGEGDYYHIEVRDKNDFETFRTQDVGDPGHIERVAGQRNSGSWDTVKWLVSKNDAHREGDTLVADTDDVRDLFDKLAATPTHITGDRFKAKPRRNIPESEKPTKAQQRARQENIKKAQQARREQA